MISSIGINWCDASCAWHLASGFFFVLLRPRFLDFLKIPFGLGLLSGSILLCFFHFFGERRPDFWGGPGVREGWAGADKTVRGRWRRGDQTGLSAAADGLSSAQELIVCQVN